MRGIVNKDMLAIGAKMVPRNQANKNITYKTNEKTQFFAIKSIENTSKNAIQIP